jgi:hypothetical protein
MHNAPRAQCADANGECPEALRIAADTSGPPPRVGFNIRQLRHENAEGYTSREIARETVEDARRDGREIAMAKDYGW